MVRPIDRWFAWMKLVPELEELGVLKAHQPEAFLGNKPSDSPVMNHAVAVYHCQTECRRTVGADPIPPSSCASSVSSASSVVWDSSSNSSGVSLRKLSSP
jgi:hypothetical protein